MIPPGRHPYHCKWCNNGVDQPDTYQCPSCLHSIHNPFAPEISLKVESELIVAKARKLKVKWTYEVR